MKQHIIKFDFKIYEVRSSLVAVVMDFLMFFIWLPRLPLDPDF
jgi:hypothetical protein